ncbi:MAG: hypothetical protein M9933_18910 [Chitinophagaceae bacterium]|nr:hypothetical protein [Chitinophagaceae bacterium]
MTNISDWQPCNCRYLINVTVPLRVNTPPNSHSIPLYASLLTAYHLCSFWIVFRKITAAENEQQFFFSPAAEPHDNSQSQPQADAGEKLKPFYFPAGSPE